VEKNFFECCELAKTELGLQAELNTTPDFILVSVTA